MQNNKREFVLVDKKHETSNVVSLSFKPIGGLNYNFTPGQYVNVKPASIFEHGKSYTISSIPTDELVTLTIKKVSNVSLAMIDTPIGSTMVFDGPYGSFYPDKTMNDVIMLAGGIGITPFFSVIRNIAESGINTKITIIYSNKTKKDIIFFNSLAKLTSDNPNLKVISCLTQEKTTDPVINESRRIDKTMIGKYTPHLSEVDYYICGSIGFVGDMWRTLKLMHIEEDKIFTEAFY